MTSLIEDMANALVSKGLVTEPWKVFAHQIHAAPDTQLVVLLTGGLEPIISSSSSTPRPGIQIYVLSSALQAAERKAQAIYDAFKNESGTIRQAIWAARSSPIYLGTRDDGRHKFVVEFQVFG